MRPLFAAVAVLAIVACSSPVEPPAINVEQVIFAPREPTIRITNRTDAPVYWFIVGRKASALVDWRPMVCDECPSIAPNATVSRRYDESLIDASEREAFVYWWHAVIVDGERRPGVVRNGIVRVR